MKHLIGEMAKIRTVDSNGRLVLATGHATPEEHLLLAREGRKQGLNVLLTHPGDIPQLPEAAALGALIEVNAAGIYRTEAGQAAAAALIHKIGAEHIIVGTDCGQTSNVYPTDCLVLAARGLRAHGVTRLVIADSAGPIALPKGFTWSRIAAGITGAGRVEPAHVGRSVPGE